MAQDVKSSNSAPNKNVVKVNVLRSNVKQTKVVDTDIVFVLDDGRTVFIRDGAVQSLLDNGFSVQFSDGLQVSGQDLLQSAGAADISSVALSAPQAAANDGVIVVQAPQVTAPSAAVKPPSGDGIKSWVAIGTPVIGGVLAGVLSGGGGSSTTPDNGNNAVKPAMPVINVIANDDKVNLTEKSAGVTVSGTSDANASVTVNWGNTTKTVTADSAGRWSASFASTEVPADAAGTTVSATVKSTAGVSSDPATKTVQVDATPPAVPVIAKVAGDNVIGPTEKASGITINGTAEAGSTVSVRFGGLDKIAAVDLGGNWSVNYTAAEIPTAGNYSVTATARDANGNVSTELASQSIIVAAAVNVSGQIAIGSLIAGHGLTVDFSLANGTPLVSGIRVNADGSFAVTNLPVGVGDVLIAKVIDGSPGPDYLDETTGVATDLNAVLLAAKAVEGNTVTMNINPLTTIAAIKAGLSADGSGTIANAAAATDANKAVAQAFGLAGIDISTTPIVTTNSAGFNAADGLSSGEKIGAVLAALSGVSSLNGGNSQAMLNSMGQSVKTNGSTGELTGQGQLDLMKGAIAADDKVDGSLQKAISDSLAAASPVTQLAIDAIATDNIITGNELANLTISGTAASGVTGISVVLGDRKVAATVNGSTWSYKLSAEDVAALSGDGAKLIQAQATLPNASSVLVSRIVSLKVTPPAKPSLNALTGDNAISDAEKAAGVSFAGKGEPGSIVVLKFGATTKEVLVDAAGTWTIRFSTAEIPSDGRSEISVSAKDAFGNISEPVTSFIEIDTVAPAKPTIRPVTGDDIISPAEKLGGVQIQGTAEARANVRLTLGKEERTATADASGNWTINLLSSQVPEDGEYALSVTQTDVSGNVSEAVTRIVKVDAQPPAKPVIQPVTSDNIISAAEKANGVTVRGTSEANASIDITWGSITRNVKASASGAWSATFTGTQIPTDGKTEITATATDSSGNKSEPAIQQVTIDTFTQEPTIAAVTTNNVINAAEKEAGVRVSGTAGAGDSVEVKLGSTSRTVFANQAGDWFVDFQSAEIPGDGPFTVTAQSTDQAGNVSGLTRRDASVDTTAPAAPVINNVSTDNIISATESAAPVEVTGTAEAGVDVVVTWGTATREVKAAANGTWRTSFEPTDIPPEGTSVVSARTRDQDLNVSTATERSVIIDTGTDRPVINVIAGNDIINATERNNGVLVTGTAEAGGTVSLVWGAVTKTVAVGADGTWSQLFVAAEIPLSGNASITATVTDKSGNTGAPQTRSFSIDTIASPAVFNNVTADNIVNAAEKNAGVQVTGTAEAGSKVVVTWGTTVKEVTVDTTGAWTTTFSASEIPGDGGTTITAVMTDLEGNVSTQSGQAVTIDTIPPAAPVVTLPIAGDGTINAAERTAGVDVAGTALPNTKVTIIWSETSSNSVSATKTVDSDSAGQWSVKFASGEISAAGSATIRVTQSDIAGNISAPATATVIVSAGPPPAPLINAVATDNIVSADEKAAGVTISGTGAATGASVSVTWGGTTKPATIAVGGNWSVNFAAGEVPADGSPVVSVTQTDAAGNVSAAATRTVTVDTTPPAVPVITTPMAVDNYINAAEKTAGVAISGTATGSTGVEVRIGGGTPKAATFTSATAWSVNFASGDIPADGSGVLVEARSIDANGNRSAWAPASGPVIIDTTRPSAPVINTPIAGDGIVNSQERANGVVVSGSAEPNAKVTIAWASSSTQTVDANALGVWTATFSGAQINTSGFAVISATQMDAAGNVSLPATRTVTLNVSAPPTPVINAVATDNIVSADEKAAGVTISGTGAAIGASVSVTWGGTTKPATIAVGGNWSVNFAAGEVPADGSPVVSVTQTDTTGNVSAAATRTVTVDTTPPAVPVITTPMAVDDYINAAEKTAGVAISGTATGSAGVEVRIGGGTPKAATFTSATAWSVNFASGDIPADGSGVLVEARSIDANGNRSAWAPASGPIIIDTIAPAAPVINAPIAGNNIIDVSERVSGFAITGTAPANTTVEVKLANQAAKSVTSNATGNWTANYSTADIPVLDGTNVVVEASTIDAAGNRSAWVQTAAPVTIDTVPPSAPQILDPIAIDNIINLAEKTAGVNIIGTAPVNCTVEVRISGGTPKTAIFTATSTGTVNAWSAIFTGAEIPPDGPSIIVEARTVDAVGNIGAWIPATNRIAVDTVAPVSPGLSVSIGNNDVINAAQKTSGVNVEVDAPGAARVEVRMGSVTKTAVVDASGTASVQFSSAEIPADGSAVPVEGRSFDLAGNANAWAEMTRVNIDTAVAAPVINVVSVDDMINLAESAANINISGTAEAFATVKLTWGTTAERTLTANATGNWFASYTAAERPGAGTSTITATQTDVAGNISGAASRSVLIDLAPPSVPVVTGMSNDYGTQGDYITDRNMVVLTGTGEANTRVELLVDNISRGFANVDSAGLWVSPEISLATVSSIGSVTANVRGIDMAGNVNSTVATRVISKQALSATQMDLGSSAPNTGFPVGTAFSVVGALNFDGMGGMTTGDINGDGRRDLILNSPNMANTSGHLVGGVTVLYGRNSWAGFDTLTNFLDLASLSTGGWVLQGTNPNDALGRGGSGFIGDLNGDTFGELIAGAPGVNSSVGAAYIVWGSGTPIGTVVGNRTILNAGAMTPAQGFVFRGLGSNEQMGHATLGISSRSGLNSDFNGDGLADFFIASALFDRVAASGQTAAADVGAVIVVFGRADRAYGSVNATTNQREMTINDLSATNGFIIRGGANGDIAGWSLASAGDVNGDGVTDLLIGARGVDRGGFANAGAAYVVYGKKTTTGQTWAGLVDDPTMPGRKILDLGGLQSSDGFMIWGENDIGEFGGSVEGLGDVNGDGFGDIVIGAAASTINGTYTAGKAFVILGSATGQGTIASGRQILDVAAMTSSQGFTIQDGRALAIELGAAVGAAGDINGDGLADIIVSAPGAEKGAVMDAGQSFVIYGKRNSEGWGSLLSGTRSVLDVSTMGPADGFSIFGRNTTDNLGRVIGDSSIISPGDLNNDGLDDLFINAPNSDRLTRNNNGEALFVYGKKDQGTGSGLTQVGTAGANTLNGGSMNDLLNGVGGADVLRGYAGDDWLLVNDANFVLVDGGAGTDTLRMNSTTGFGLNLSALATGQVIRDIEVIDMFVGTGASTLTVTQQTLLDLSTTSNRLTVLGDSGDTVNANGFVVGGTQIVNGITYNTYTSGAAELWTQQGIVVSGAVPPPVGFVAPEMSWANHAVLAA